MRPFLTLTLVLLTLISHSQIITTVVGKGVSPTGIDGDGGLAVNAHLGLMNYSDLAFDAAGNMYITQQFDNTIRKVDLAGVITTIAGTVGVLGYSGDGGPATSAIISHPTKIIVDNADNIIFSDQTGLVLRQIDPTGKITTISAPYTGTCAGEGVPLSLATFSVIIGLTRDAAGNIYVSDEGCNTVRKINTSRIITTVAGNGTQGFSGDGGPATSAQLAAPQKVGVDNAGNIYIPDVINHRIRKVSTSGIITTFAGDGNYSENPTSLAELNGGPAIEVDNAGNIYVAGFLTVRKIDPAGNITRYAGNGTFGYSGDGGPADQAQMTQIQSLRLDAAGNLYIVDLDNFVIRKVSNCVTATFSLQPASAPVCDAGNATFKVSATNANSLRWQMNAGMGWVDLSDKATYAGSNTNMLEVNGLDPGMNNNQFRCVATNTCADIYSDPATLTVQSMVFPSVAISTGSPIICSGVNATFQAVPTNEGTSPVYQWQVNGVSAGTNTTTYANSGLNNGDVITCMLTSNALCATTPTAASNPITMTVDPAVTPAISVSAPAAAICSGTPVNFTASATNEGAAPSYQWQVNGVNTGTNSASYTNSGLNNGDIITCMLTSNALCATTPTATSSSVTMTVDPTPTVALPPDTIIALGQSLVLKASVTGPVTSYQWTPADGLDNPYAAAPVATPLNTTTYQVLVTTDASCAASEKVTVAVFKELKMPDAFTPNGDGKNDLFRIPPLFPLKIKAFAVYNHWGARVFFTSNSTVGWDGNFGGQLQPTGTYAWLIEYEDLSTKKRMDAKGTVILIR